MLIHDLGKGINIEGQEDTRASSHLEEQILMKLLIEGMQSQHSDGMAMVRY